MGSQNKCFCDHSFIRLFQAFYQAQGLLLQCATPDSLARLHMTELKMEVDRLWEIYFEQQHHSSLIDYLNGVLPSEAKGKGISAQVCYVLK